MTEYNNLRTSVVRAGVDQDQAGFGAVMPPLHLSANFSFVGFSERRRHDYTRSGNPTRDLLAGALAELEGGAGAVVTASGMAALGLVLGLLDAGDRDNAHNLLRPPGGQAASRDSAAGAKTAFNPETSAATLRGLATSPFIPASK